MIKPLPQAHYPSIPLLEWLSSVRPAAAAYVREHIRENDAPNGSLVSFDLTDNTEDMRAHPDAYKDCGYEVSDLEWLASELGSTFWVHAWW